MGPCEALRGGGRCQWASSDLPSPGSLACLPPASPCPPLPHSLAVGWGVKAVTPAEEAGFHQLPAQRPWKVREGEAPLKGGAPLGTLWCLLEPKRCKELTGGGSHKQVRLGGETESVLHVLHSMGPEVPQDASQTVPREHKGWFTYHLASGMCVPGATKPSSRGRKLGHPALVVRCWWPQAIIRLRRCVKGGGQSPGAVQRGPSGLVH